MLPLSSLADSSSNLVISMQTLQIVGAIIGIVVGITALFSFIWAIIKAARTAGQVTERFESKIDAAMTRMDAKADMLSMRMEHLSTTLESLVKREVVRDAKLDGLSERIIKLETTLDDTRRFTD